MSDLKAPLLVRLRENNPDKPTSDRFAAADRIEHLQSVLSKIESEITEWLYYDTPVPDIYQLLQRIVRDCDNSSME